MSDQTSIFNSNTDPATQPDNNSSGNSNPNNAPSNNDFANLLSEIKNERGEPKYKTLQDALIGLKNAQEYIPNIKTELEKRDAEIAELRSKAERMAELERTVEALTSQRDKGASTNTPPITEEQIAELVNRTLTTQQRKALETSNVSAVVTTLQQAFGAEAEKKFYDKATELGMSVQEMNALAAKSPKAVLTMLGISEQPVNKPGTPAPKPGTVNTAALQPNQNTFIGRNPKPSLIGATTQDIAEASQRAKKMVEELHAQGKSVHDLTDPKVFFKQFQ